MSDNLLRLAKTKETPERKKYKLFLEVKPLNTEKLVRIRKSQDMEP